MSERYKTLKEFWPYYVREHSQPRTRQLHFVGNTNLIIWVFLALVRRKPKLLVWAVVSSYAFAWVGHFFVEKNRPATFQYPLMSGLCDLWMYVQQWRGKMDDEAARYLPNK